MLATSVGMAISLPAVLAVPVKPGLAPIVAVLLVLTVMGVWLLSWWVSRALVIPGANGELPRWWDRRNAKTKRPYMRTTVNVCSFLYYMGAAFILTQWWIVGKDWNSLGFGLGLMVGGVIIYGFFALMWGRAGSKVDRFLSKDLGVAPIMVFAGLVYVGNIWLVPAQLAKLQIGPAAPWSEQWAAVQNAMASKYPDAALWRITANHVYEFPTTCDASLQMNLLFTKPDGEDISVHLRDANPEASVHVYDPQAAYLGTPRSTTDELLRAKELSETIRISPRDALQRVKTDLGTEVPGKGVCDWPSVTLYLAGPSHSPSKTFDALGKPAVWQVIFNDAGPSVGQTGYWIDAQTGDILQREQTDGP
jgi:hypothetical protein